MNGRYCTFNALQNIPFDKLRANGLIEWILKKQLNDEVQQ